MDEKIDREAMTSEVSQKLEPKKKRGTRAIFVILLVFVLLGASFMGGYWWRDKVARDELGKKATEIVTLQAEVSSLKKQAEKKDGAKDNSKNETICTAKRPNESGVENIKASITSGNTAVLEGYMAPSVNVIYAASDGLGPRTPANAVSDITSFITQPSGAVWSFDVPTAKSDAFRAGYYKQYFPENALIAQSTNERIVSLSFDCDGKLATVLFVPNEDILTQ